MIQVTKQFRAEIAHRLKDHPGACSNLHGHSYLFEITIAGEPDPKTGMVLDFKILKDVIEICIGEWDHALLLEKSDPLIKMLSQYPGKLIQVPQAPTAEWMAEATARRLDHSEINVVQVRVWETATSYADWKKEECKC